MTRDSDAVAHIKAVLYDLPNDTNWAGVLELILASRDLNPKELKDLAIGMKTECAGYDEGMPILKG